MVIFRADGNAQIGSGHIMRCLSIADAFKRKNIDCLFVLADKSFRALIEARGFAVSILDTDYRNMDSEFDNLQKIIQAYSSRIVIVDSYFVTKSYLEKLKALSFLVYIDDLATGAYPVDVLVNYNINGSWHDYKNIYLEEYPSCPRLLLGVTYAPLRDMFRNVPIHHQKRIVNDVLISTGGADPLHLALKLAKHVERKNTTDNKRWYATPSNNDSISGTKNYHFLVGTLNSDYEQIKRIAERNEKIHIHYNVKDMRRLISSCDLIVSAAGSTMYEIAACGVPVITYALADNQVQCTEAFDKTGLAVSCGDLRGKSNAVSFLFDTVNSVAKNFALRKQIGEKMQRMVDGNGADRLVGKLLDIY